MLRRCRAIIFDLDDTLVPTSKIDRAAILAAASGVERCAARFAELLKAEPFPAPDSSHDVPSWRSMLWARALASSEDAEVSISPAARSAYESWSEQRLTNFRFDEEVVALVKRLQAAGYKTGVLTNGHKDVQRAKTAACGAEALFGAANVIVAGEHPEQKPHPSIFRVACRALGEEPEHVVMVGDSYNADVTGGINAGLLATVWIQPAIDATSESMMHDHVSAVPAGKPPPTHTIASVLDLEAVLERVG